MITLFRGKRIAQTLSGIALNAIESGAKGKAALMPEIGRALSFKTPTLQFLNGLGRAMSDLIEARAAMRREATMRAQFAHDL
jgi:succinylglutamate desuccinylase